jgi:phosphoribosylanthranilate isomerase
MNAEKTRTPAPRVKVCGLTSLANALQCAEAGVDLLGFNFYPESKRFIPFPDATHWLGELAGTVERVGLFVNAGRDEVLRVMESGLLDTAQFHGDETAEDMAFYSGRGIRFFKAIRVRGEESVRDVGAFSTRRIVLDAFSAEGYGGTGEKFDWTLARRVVASHPELEVMLSGGLDPANVAEAVQVVGPAIVDVASGVESTPGVKDIAKVVAFVRAAKALDLPED